MDDRRQPLDRRRLLAVGAALAAMLLLAGCGGGSSNSSSSSGGSTSTTSTTGAPFVLGTTDGENVGRTVAGIPCQTSEQVLFHIHAHVAVFVDGRPGVIPEGIGIGPPRQEEASTEGPFVVAGSCFYWLHTHTDDGIIHIESPVPRTYTLGNFFDVWNQPLSPTRVGLATGPVTAYLDGKPFTGNPRSIPLGAHGLIQLDVGTPNVAPEPYTFPQGY